MSITRIDHTIPPPFLGWPCGPPTPTRNPRQCLRLRPVTGWKRRPGGQRQTWELCVQKAIQPLGWSIDDVVAGDLAQNRSRWKALVRDVLASQGEG